MRVVFRIAQLSRCALAALSLVVACGAMAGYVNVWVTTEIMPGTMQTGVKSRHLISVDTARQRILSCVYSTGKTKILGDLFGDHLALEIGSINDKFLAVAERHKDGGTEVIFSGKTASGARILGPIEYEFSLVLHREGWNLKSRHKRFPRYSISVGPGVSLGDGVYPSGECQKVYSLPAIAEGRGYIYDFVHKPMGFRELRNALGEACCEIEDSVHRIGRPATSSSQTDSSGGVRKLEHRTAALEEYNRAELYFLESAPSVSPVRG